MLRAKEHGGAYGFVYFGTYHCVDAWQEICMKKFMASEEGMVRTIPFLELPLYRLNCLYIYSGSKIIFAKCNWEPISQSRAGVKC